ncbi:uridine kinase family protein [Nocardioides soli]|uniref:Uridine kinase n=1 Tax=Nocardioides soli TaxID=1036020 RepID=A0A7W4VW52_9ACTN|nr:uridine kinase [Nocardioides soli]MBB3042876.1 uridine kinase [Nocardioides soli]
MTLHPALHARSLVVAITGGSGAGKTALAGALVDHYGESCGLLEMDSYYRHFDGLTAREREALDWDSIETVDVGLLTEHLVALGEGRRVDVPEFDFTVRLRSPRTTTFLPPRILVLEGMFALAIDHVITTADLKVFLDAPEHVRYQRRHDRDVATRGRSSDSIRDQWRTTVLPGHRTIVEPQRRRASLVVDGGQPIDGCLGDIIEHLDALLLQCPVSEAG